MQWSHMAEDTYLPVVAQVYKCKRFPPLRTPETLEEGTEKVQHFLQVRCRLSSFVRLPMCGQLCTMSG